MRNIALIALAALLTAAAVPALAQEPSNQDQVICNLASKNCLSQSEAIQKRVKKIQKDIAKGKTYSTEDVQKLEQKLKEAQELLDKLEGKSPAK